MCVCVCVCVYLVIKVQSTYICHKFVIRCSILRQYERLYKHKYCQLSLEMQISQVRKTVNLRRQCRKIRT